MKENEKERLWGERDEAESQRKAAAAWETTPEGFRTNQARFQLGSDPGGDNEAVLIFSTQTDQTEDDGRRKRGKERRPQGQNCLASIQTSKEGKHLSNQLWLKMPAARIPRSTVTQCVIYSKMNIQASGTWFKPLAVSPLFSSLWYSHLASQLR